MKFILDDCHGGTARRCRYRRDRLLRKLARNYDSTTPSARLLYDRAPFEPRYSNVSRPLGLFPFPPFFLLPN